MSEQGPPQRPDVASPYAIYLALRARTKAHQEQVGYLDTQLRLVENGVAIYSPVALERLHADHRAENAALVHAGQEEGTWLEAHPEVKTRLERETGVEDSAGEPHVNARARAAQQARSGLPLTRLGDLLQEPDEQTAWLVDTMLPSGGFSLLVAKPKVGKSTLARNLALSVAQGTAFLGKATTHGPVLYLALEEKRAEVKKHFQAMGATGEEDLYIFAASAPVDALQQIRVVVEEKKPALIIIDPLFRLTRVKDGNDYAQVTAALEPVLVLARETGAHVLCVHHAGKGERDGGDSILGSTAIFGAVDTALIMRRKERYRTLCSIQRYGDDLPETVLQFDAESRTSALGHSQEQEERTRVATAIVACLHAQEDDTEKGAPLTEARLNDEVEGRNAYKREALRELVKTGDLVRLGKGGKSDPFHYCVKGSRFCASPREKNGPEWTEEI